MHCKFPFPSNCFQSPITFSAKNALAPPGFAVVDEGLAAGFEAGDPGAAEGWVEGAAPAGVAAACCARSGRMFVFPSASAMLKRMIRRVFMAGVET